MPAVTVGEAWTEGSVSSHVCIRQTVVPGGIWVVWECRWLLWACWGSPGAAGVGSCGQNASVVCPGGVQAADGMEKLFAKVYQ